MQGLPSSEQVETNGSRQRPVSYVRATVWSYELERVKIGGSRLRYCRTDYILGRFSGQTDRQTQDRQGQTQDRQTETDRQNPLYFRACGSSVPPELNSCLPELTAVYTTAQRAWVGSMDF